MPHGRVEQPWEGRQHAIRPSLLLVLRRGTAEQPTVRPVSPAVAARALVAGTYAAGELRRYWAFSATLALGTGLGPAHPAIVGEAERLAQSVPCLEVMLPARPGTSLAEIVDLSDSTVAAPSATTEFVAEAATKAATKAATGADRHRPAVSMRMTGVQG
jgi:hypothetical protein